jgi:hypothetical protein
LQTVDRLAVERLGCFPALEKCPGARFDAECPRVSPARVDSLSTARASAARSVRPLPLAASISSTNAKVCVFSVAVPSGGAARLPAPVGLTQAKGVSG